MAVQRDLPAMDETGAAQIIEQMGGREAVLKELDDFREVVRRMELERAALTGQYPDRWVAVSRDGLLAVGDTLEEICGFAKAKGLNSSDFLVAYLESDPPALIL